MNRPLGHILSPVLLSFLAGCASGTGANRAGASEASLLTERPTSNGLIEQQIDLNRDEMADVFNFYRDRKETTRLLVRKEVDLNWDGKIDCLLYTSPSPRDLSTSRMPSSA